MTLKTKDALIMTSMFIGKQQRKDLRVLGKKFNRTPSELIRTAIDQLLAANLPTNETAVANDGAVR